jgi:chaperonin cofactor prefoldin
MAVPDEQAILSHFQSLRSEVDTIWSKITELDLERQEHALVLETLQPLEAGRRCFRLVGGVLVERTVGEVSPAVARNREALEEVRVLTRVRAGATRWPLALTRACCGARPAGMRLTQQRTCTC